MRWRGGGGLGGIRTYGLFWESMVDTDPALHQISCTPVNVAVAALALVVVAPFVNNSQVATLSRAIHFARRNSLSV